jgi:hypothetical protein
MTTFEQSRGAEIGLVDWWRQTALGPPLHPPAAVQLLSFRPSHFKIEVRYVFQYVPYCIFISECGTVVNFTYGSEEKCDAIWA